MPHLSDVGTPAQTGASCVHVLVQKDEEKRPHQAGSNLVFLSARPESYEVRLPENLQVSMQRVSSPRRLRLSRPSTVRMQKL